MPFGFNLPSLKKPSYYKGYNLSKLFWIAVSVLLILLIPYITGHIDIYFFEPEKAKLLHTAFGYWFYGVITVMMGLCILIIGGMGTILGLFILLMVAQALGNFISWVKL